MSWLYKPPIILSVIILLLCVFLKWNNHPLIERLQFLVFDGYQQIKPREYTSQPVKIIDIDEKSLKKIGQWPWPRTKMAQLVDKLVQAGAKSIAFDITFPEKDRTSPKQIIDIWGQQNQMADFIEKLPDHDDIFAQSILAADNVITSFALLDHNLKSTPTLKASPSILGATQSEQPSDYLDEYNSSIKSLNIFENAAKGNGFINGNPDADGVIRKMTMLEQINGHIYPSLLSETLRVAQFPSNYIILMSGKNQELTKGISAIKIGEYDVPTQPDSSFWIYYTGTKEQRYIPAWQIFEDGFDVSKIKNNMLFIGTSAIGLKDIRSTPLSKTANGVEVHVQALEQILSNEFLYQIQYQLAEILFIIIIAICVILIVYKSSALFGALFTLFVLISNISISWVGFSQFLLLIDPVTPSITILLIFLTCSIAKHIGEEKQKQQIRNAFSHYMSPDMVNQLAENPEQLQLGGETKTLSVLFCDIRGFTTISEKFDAHELTQFLNNFLTPMTDIILSNKGTIDKYMGDAIMAFWNAPLDDKNHAYNSSIAALKMFKALQVVNEDENHPPIKIGIGINTGQCCVGNMGSQQRFDYSVIGDEVNLASRLEGQSKTYCVDVVIGQETQKQIPQLAVIEIDYIQVKGKNNAVNIYSLLGDEELANNEDFISFKEKFHNALQQYRAQKWAESLVTIAQCEAITTQLNIDLSGLFALYKQRIVQYQASAPDKNWNGAYIATSK